MIKFFYFLLLFLEFGCARPAKIVLKVSEAEKGRPTSRLVRKIEILRKDESGHVVFRRSLATNGLDQPASLSDEEMAEMSLKEKGSVEARAFTADGLLVLIGGNQTPSETRILEVLLDRDPLLDSNLSSAFRDVTISNFPELAGTVISAASIYKKAQEGQCLQIPLIRVFPRAPEFPTLVFSGNLKAVPMSFDLGTRNPTTFAFEEEAPIERIPTNARGNGLLVLGPQLRGGRLLQSRQDTLVRLYSSAFDVPVFLGCLAISTEVDIVAPVINKTVYPEFLSPGDNGRRIAQIRLSNDNDTAVLVTWEGKLKWTDDQPVQGDICYRFNHSDIMPIGQNSTCQWGVMINHWQLEAHTSLDINILGVRFSNGAVEKRNIRLDLKFRAKEYPREGAPDRHVQDLRLDIAE